MTTAQVIIIACASGLGLAFAFFIFAICKAAAVGPFPPSSSKDTA